MAKIAKYTKGIQFNCTPKQFSILNLRLKNSSLTKAEFLRQSIFSNEIVVKDKKIEARKLFLLNNISNNINQIAKYSNTHKILDEHILNELKKVSILAHDIFDSEGISNAD